MKITVLIERTDVFKLYLIQTLRAKSTYITVFCIFLIVFGLMSFKHGFPASTHDFIYYAQTSILFAIGGIFLLLILCIFLSMIFFKKNYGASKGYECQISPDGICFNNTFGEALIKWGGIQKIHLTNSYILYDLSGSKSFFIPKHCFNSLEDFENFTNHSKFLWDQAKTNNAEKKNTHKTNLEMSITTAINRAEAFSCSAALFFKTKPLYIGLFVVIIAISFLFLFKRGFPEISGHWISLFQVSVIAGIGMTCSSFIFLIIGVLLKYPRNINDTHKVYYEANSIGLFTKASLGESTWKWAGIRKAMDRKSFLYLQYDFSQYSYIPKNCFNSPEEYQAFASYVMTQWKKAKDAKT